MASTLVLHQTGGSRWVCQRKKLFALPIALAAGATTPHCTLVAWTVRHIEGQNGNQNCLLKAARLLPSNFPQNQQYCAPSRINSTSGSHGKYHATSYIESFIVSDDCKFSQRRGSMRRTCRKKIRPTVRRLDVGIARRRRRGKAVAIFNQPSDARSHIMSVQASGAHSLTITSVHRSPEVPRARAGGC